MCTELPEPYSLLKELTVFFKYCIHFLFNFWPDYGDIQINIRQWLSSILGSCSELQERSWCYILVLLLAEWKSFWNLSKSFYSCMVMLSAEINHFQAGVLSSASKRAFSVQPCSLMEMSFLSRLLLCKSSHQFWPSRCVLELVLKNRLR